jgi:2-polyprenyl-3-methyl-5-hydroxy-6-metoxy-1,4-benzoquinol methylase
MTSPLTSCLCCGGVLTHIIDFGPTRLANTYNVEEKFPLALNLCRSCFHLQLTHSVSPEILFRDYFYMSGTSRTAKEFFRWFAQMVTSGEPCHGKTILDIACNDGSQLDEFKKLGFKTFGCDPAANLASISGDKGHTVLLSMFEDMKSNFLFDIITAQHVLAHTPIPLVFLRNAASMMHDGSRLYVVTSQADMIVKGECDAIYHEHVSYFNTRSMRKLAQRAGLVLLDIATHPMHGTSYIFTFGLLGTFSARVESRMAIEECRGMYAEDTYWAWALEAKRSIARFKKLIEWHGIRDYVTVGLGAAAKGISMLNMAEIRLDHLYDTTPLKQGKVASSMLIEPFDLIGELSAEKVLFVLLAWNFEQEVRENVAKLRDNHNDVYILNK